MRVVANSVPKSGTHLLGTLLTILGFEQMGFGGIRSHLVSGPFTPAKRLLRARSKDKVSIGVVSPQQIDRRWLKRRLRKVREDSFVTAHCIYTPELASLFREEGMKVVCILRDPRDTAVSQLHHIKERKQHFAHKAFVALPSDRERLLFSIRGGELGGRELLSLDERYRRFSGWSKDADTVVVRFEDVIGPRGGGSAEAQREAVERIASHVGVEADQQTMLRIEENLFGRGKTFRRGMVGGWREEFGPEHIEAAREVVGDLLVELGYERDHDW